jgi:hypothetical protein
MRQDWVDTAEKPCCLSPPEHAHLHDGLEDGINPGLREIATGRPKHWIGLKHNNGSHFNATTVNSVYP